MKVKDLTNYIHRLTSLQNMIHEAMNHMEEIVNTTHRTVISSINEQHSVELLTIPAKDVTKKAGYALHALEKSKDAIKNFKETLSWISGEIVIEGLNIEEKEEV